MSFDVGTFHLKCLLLRQKSLRSCRRLRKQQALSPHELDALNWSKRKRLLQHAYTNVPFYTRRFDEIGLHPDEIRNPDDFLKVPFLTRQDIRDNFNDLVAVNSDPRDHVVSTTGGSTGTPLRVLQDRRARTDAVRWRMLRWWGLAPGMGIARVWRIPDVLRKHAFRRKVMLWPTREILLDAAVMTERAMRRFIDDFNHFRSPILQGYVGAIEELATFVENRGLSVHSPRAVWVTAAPVTSVQRKRIASVFRAPVFDQYGSCEILYMAAQCNLQNALHRMHDVCHIEFVDRDGLPCPLGEPGDIAVTDLDNYAFPLIRYRNGDRGRALSGECGCGITLPLMDAVKGRVSELFKMPNGDTISGEYLTTVFDAFPDAVKAFQIRQKEDASITVSVVPNPAFSGTEAALRAVEIQLREVTRGQVPIEIVMVESIQHDRGKTRYIVSDLANEPPVSQRAEPPGAVR